MQPKISGKKKEHKPRLFGPDIPCEVGGGLPREGAGAKKFGMSLETQQNQTFGFLSSKKRVGTSEVREKTGFGVGKCLKKFGWTWIVIGLPSYRAPFPETIKIRQE